MLKVTVSSTDVKTIVANRNKKEFKLQTAWVTLKGDPHPTKFEFFLPSNNTPPYPVGEYTFDPEKLIAVKNGNLQLRVELQPLAK